MIGRCSCSILSCVERLLTGPKIYSYLTNIVLIASIFSSSIMVQGQAAKTADSSSGLTPGQTYGSAHENIDYSTGNLDLQIPLLTIPGRHGSDLHVGLTYDSKPLASIMGTWSETQGNSTYLLSTESNLARIPGGWRLNIPVLQTSTHTTLQSTGLVNNACYQNFIVTTADGSSHQFGNQTQCSTTMKNSPFTVSADPSSNINWTGASDLPVLVLDTTNPSDIILRGKDGTTTHFFMNLQLPAADPNGEDGQPIDKLADEIVDANGNIVSITQSGNNITLTDTVGRAVTLAFNTPTPSLINALTSVTYNDSNGVQQTIGFNYSTVSYNYTFINPSSPQAANVLAVTGSAPALSSVTFPNGLSYHFEYNTSLGELSKITYPTGGYTRYEFTTFTHWWNAPDVFNANAATIADYRELTAKYICRDAHGSCTTTPEDKTTYSPTVDGTMTNNQYMDVTDTLGNRTRYQFNFGTNANRVQSGPYFARELFRYVYQGATTPLITTQTEYNNLEADGTPTVTSMPKRITTTLNDSNQVKKVEYDYDPDVIDNVIAERDYDYGNGGPGPLIRRTKVSWLKTNPINNVNYLALNILNRKASDSVYDSLSDTCNGQNRPCAQTLYEYDNYTAGLSPSGAVQHAAAYNSSAGYTVRGNITQVQAYRNTDGVMLSTRSQYDDAGNVISIIDPANHTTTFSYSDSWANTVCIPTGGNAAAYLTSTTNAKQQTATSKYNSCSGTVASISDVNGQTTSYIYDLMARVTQTTLPSDVNGNHPQINVAFNESSLPLSVTTTKKVTTSSTVASTATLDGLGRVVKTESNSDPLGLIVDITYDELGRKATESNPHRTATGGATDGIATYQYDALSRVKQITHPDGTIASTEYLGSAVRVTDEGNGTRSVQRISQADGLGRMISVCEVSSGPFVGAGGTSASSLVGPGGTPSACGQLFAATGFLTTYSYDVLNNVTAISQGGGMARSFTYDSLSHLLQSVNPESGTILYTYDLSGNVQTKTDARGFTTTYGYDQLNRLTSKTYSNGGVTDPNTPPVTLTYDVCPTGCPAGMNTQYLVGRLVAASTSGATTFNSYDALGRIINQWQCTPVNCGTGNFSMGYTYDLTGDLGTETTPAGATLTYGFDVVDRLQSVTSSLSDSNHPANLVSNLQYDPMGVASGVLGNGVTESFSYTKRGQLQTLAAGGIIVINHPATSGSGSVTISGSENSTTPPATSAHGSVEIDGSEQSECILISADGFGCDEWEYDSGSVSITVGSFTVSSSFSQFVNNTAASLATDLTNKLNASNSPVTASLSGALISITSKATGSAANISLSSSSTSTDAMNSFSGNPSGPTLTGGGGGQAVYDTGSVTITVNGTAYSVTYGSSSTTSSIASALASTLSSGTWVNASATGNVVSIAAKTAGASTNYTLSAASSTNNPQGLFSGPSFSTSASGTALTGGANAFTTTQGATIYSLNMGYAPNGNVISANDSVNGNWTYSYDDFNRVTGASKNNGAQTYNYVYDRYGNRWQQNAPQGGYVQLLVFNSGNNRMDGYTYDASGNLLNDGTNNFTYDAESRLITSVHAGATTTYIYDAGGRRVRKSVAGVTTDYIYNLGGTVTEINSAAAWTRAEIYAGGRHVATYAGGVSGTTYFHHADWLETERVRSDITGAACETVTSLIFGDGQSVSGSCGDPSTRHFTGKQRDDESGLDDFGARYYSSQLGRFISADWSGVPAPVPYANLTNPQTLNLYALVHENPVTFADLDGHVDPGQLAFSDGMGVTPRMRGGNGNAYGCLDMGCGSYITIWQLTINGVGTDQFFDSEAAGKAYIASQSSLQAPGAQANTSAWNSFMQGLDSMQVGKYTVGQLANVLTNESRDLQFVGPSQPNQDPLEAAKYAEANAILNNALQKHPHLMAPASISQDAAASAGHAQDLQIMRQVYFDRMTGRPDPTGGRTFFGNSAQNLKSRPIGNSRQTVFLQFGPFFFQHHSGQYIYIYNDPR